MLDETSDPEWSQKLDAAKRGDRNALGELLQAYWAPLWEHAAKHIDNGLKSKQAASDVVQETLAEAHLHIREFRGTTPPEFQAWLRTMLANNIRDVWRHYCATQKRSTQREVPLDGLQDGLRSQHEPAGSLLGQFMLQEQIDALYKILARLPEESRAIIQMRHWESMTFKEIGASLGMSADAARQHWYRAIELIAELLEQDDVA